MNHVYPKPSNLEKTERHLFKALFSGAQGHKELLKGEEKRSRAGKLDAESALHSPGVHLLFLLSEHGNRLQPHCCRSCNPSNTVIT